MIFSYRSQFRGLGNEDRKPELANVAFIPLGVWAAVPPGNSWGLNPI
jgi:hypothetical protein